MEVLSKSYQRAVVDANGYNIVAARGERGRFTDFPIFISSNKKIIIVYKQSTNDIFLNLELLELETQTQIAARLSFIQEDKATALLKQRDEIGKMLTGLRKSLSEKTE